MKTKTSWKGKTVLVTGATGFIGSHLCAALRAAGARVHGVGRSRPQPPVPGVTYHRGDLSDANVARRLVRRVRPDFLFHLASHVAGSRDMEMVAPTLRDNLCTTVHLMTAAFECQTSRMVIAGSLEEPQGPAKSAVPSSPYAAAKQAGSAYARMFHALYGLPVVHARLFMVYGPGQRDLKKLVPYVILSLLKGHAPQLSSGARQVDWVYVEDVVRGLMALGQTPGIEGKSFDLGTGHMTTVREVSFMLSRMIRPDLRPVLGARPARPMEQIQRANVNATTRAVGWKPRVKLSDGLRKTAAWYSQSASAT